MEIQITPALKKLANQLSLQINQQRWSDLLYSVSGDLESLPFPELIVMLSSLELPSFSFSLKDSEIMSLVRLAIYVIENYDWMGLGPGEGSEESVKLLKTLGLKVFKVLPAASRLGYIAIGRYTSNSVITNSGLGLHLSDITEI